MKLSTRILLGMVAGIAVGVLLRPLADRPDSFAATLGAWLVDTAFEVGGSIFVASLKLMVVPLLFVSLVNGASAMGASARMGRIAGKTLALYLVTTGIAISLALLLANLIDPGLGVGLEGEVDFDPAAAPSAKEVLISIFPSNPVKAMADGNMLQIIVFSLLMGIALARSGAAGARAREVFASFNEVIMTMVTLLMHLAPYGVFCLLAKLFAELGFAAILDLGKYFGTVLLALAVHGTLTYGLLLGLVARRSPLTFLRNVRPALLFGFSTASSNATLPVTLSVAERRLGIDNRVASFTVPLGATINMDGTAIMQGVATVFIAQAYGLDISMGGYLAVILTATLASIGTAGVPGVGLVTLAMVLEQVGLPVAGIALIIGIDRLLDMARTAVNVCGDLAVSTAVAGSEGLLDDGLFAEVSDRDPYAAQP
ncbi:MAG: dicarboxylate/amino acid:cation symporter [Pseudomonadota bacterium]